MQPKAMEITETELEVIQVLWKTQSPMTAHAVCDALAEKQWKYTTVSTLLSRLVEKEAVSYDKNGKTYLYYALLEKEAYMATQTKNLVSKLYDGSVKNLAVSLFQTGALSQDDIAEIKKMFDL